MKSLPKLTAKWKVSFIVTVIILLSLIYTAIHVYSSNKLNIDDTNAIRISNELVTSWYSAGDNTTFEAACKSSVTKDFEDKKLQALLTGRKNELKYTPTIIKTLIIDKRKSMEEAVVFYTVKDSTNKFDSNMVANIVLYREKGTFKIQDLALMERSTDIPKNSDELEKQNSKRFTVIRDTVTEWINSRNTRDLNKYVSFISDSAPVSEYTKAFQGEQDIIKSNNLKFHVEVSGVFVKSSSDERANVLILTNQVVDTKKYNSPLELNMALEDDVWKISSIMQNSTLSEE